MRSIFVGLNAERAARPAYIDDTGTLNYGQLAERVRSVAAGLRSLGIKREERVLLLMHDVNDWPVSFLGAIYAGVIPVAVNTLLSGDDYAYMLEHSRAQAVLVSGAHPPGTEDRTDEVRSRSAQSDRVTSNRAPQLREVEFESFAGRARTARSSGEHARRRPGFLALLVRLHWPPEGRRAFARQPLLDDRTVRQGRSWTCANPMYAFPPQSFSSPTGWAMRLTFPWQSALL